MARLFPLLPFQPDETPWSWAARMAAFHIRGPITTFLRDLGLDPFVFSIGDHDEMTRLCALAGQDPVPVLRNSLIRHNHRSYRLGGEPLIDSLCPTRDLRFCPACLAEDDAAASAAQQDTAIHRRERLIWRLKPIRFCPVHALPLIRRDRPGGNEGKGVFAEIIPEARAMLEDLTGKRKPAFASPLQAYVMGRIEGHCGPAWLDDQPLEQVIRITELLGAVIEFGPQVAFDDLSVRDQDTASACGWDYTSKGKDGIHRAFGILQASFDTKQSVARSCKWNPFDPLLDEIRHPGENSPLLRLFEEYIASTAGT